MTGASEIIKSGAGAMDIMCTLIAAVLLTFRGARALEEPASPPNEETIAQCRKAIGRLEAEIRDLERRLENLPKLDADDRKKQIAKLWAMIEAKQKERDNLKKRLADLELAKNSPDTGPPGSLAAAQKALAEARARGDELAKKEQGLIDAPAAEGGGIPNPKPVPEGMRSTYMTLVKGRVVPIKKPYYKFEDVLVSTGDGSVTFATKVTRAKDGEPVGEAIKPGGCLDTMLNELDPAKQYFRFLVCADSIPAYRAAAAAVCDRGFLCAWDTYADGPLWQTNSAATPGPGGVIGGGSKK